MSRHSVQLTLRDVSLHRRGLRLVTNLSLDVDAGETVAVMGPSGAGKTTLLRAVAGLVAAEGHIERGSGRVGVVFQEPRLLPWRTVRQNVRVVCPTDRPNRPERWLEAVGLRDAKDLYPAQLSGGMAQRVAVARALAYGAPLVVVDEPFTNLDAATASALRAELTGHLAAEQAAVLWVTHDDQEAATVADRTLRLSGPPTGEWFLDEPTHAYLEVLP